MDIYKPKPGDVIVCAVDYPRSIKPDYPINKHIVNGYVVTHGYDGGTPRKLGYLVDCINMNQVCREFVPLEDIISCLSAPKFDKCMTIR